MKIDEVFAEPKDILEKLVREGNRFIFFQLDEDVPDVIFNFSVTAHCLRDWCKEYLNIRNYDNEWSDNDYLKIAQDIANSLKHFKITRYTPNVSEVKATEMPLVPFYYVEDFNEKLKALSKYPDLMSEYTENNKSFVIILEDGRSFEALDYVTNIIKYWTDYFDRKSIPRNKILDFKYIFVNRLFWDKFFKIDCEIKK